VTDRIDYLQGHQFVGEQLQGPMPITGRRLAQPHGNQLRFRLTVQLARRRRFPPLLAFQSQFKAFGDQAFPHVFDRLHPAVEGLGDPNVRPSRPVGIRLEQNLSTTKSLR